MKKSTVSILQTLAQTAYIVADGKITADRATQAAIDAADRVCHAMAKHSNSISLGHSFEDYRSAVCRLNPQDEAVLTAFADSVAGDINLFAYNLLCDAQLYCVATFVQLFNKDEVAVIAPDSKLDADSLSESKYYIMTDSAYLMLPPYLLSIANMTLMSVAISLVMEAGNDTAISPAYLIAQHRESAQRFACKHKLYSNEDFVATLKDYDRFCKLSPSVYRNAEKLHKFISRPESIKAILNYREQQKLCFPAA